MNRWIVIAFLVIVVIVIAYITGSSLLKPEMKMTQDQAVALALEELRYTYHNATVEIYGTENDSTVAGESTWKIAARVIYGRNTLCPNLTLVELHYPKFGFVSREPDTITRDCQVLGCRGTLQCRIDYPEEAVILPLDMARNPEVQPDMGRFLDAAGRDTIQAAAAPQPVFTSISNNTYSNVWVATYTAPSLNSTFEVILNGTTGRALEYYTREK